MQLPLVSQAAQAARAAAVTQALQQVEAVSAQVAKAGTGADVIKYSALSGLAFYVYNEASFSVLALMDPVSHSVANTLKRVVIIVASCIVFKTPLSTIGAIGSAIAVGGTLLYSLAKRKFHVKK
jgi:solute carrier family 35 protein E1